MLDKEGTVKCIKERMANLNSSEVCALFLLAVERKGQSEEKQEPDSERVMERISSLLAHFFHATDIVGYMGNQQFAAFLTGNCLTGKVAREKAGTFSDVLLFAEEDLSAWYLTSYVGVYVFRGGQETSFESVFRKAESALEMAEKDGQRHYFVYGTDGILEDDFQPSNMAASSRMLLNYIDEGVRILKMGEKLEIHYISPGFFRRLSLTEDYDSAGKIQIHPADLALYEQMVRAVAEDGRPRDGKYRVSGDGSEWISCRFKFLRIAASDQEATILEISHNISGLKHLKNQYDEKREWLSFVAEETDGQLWEVDLKARTFRLLYTRNLVDGRQTLYEDFPESLIRSGRIHKESAESFRKFAEGMYGGKPEGRENFIIQYRQTSCYGWASMSYRLLYDVDGHPEKVIGMKEDLSYQPDGQSRFFQRRIMPSDLYPDLYCYFQANLSRNIPEKLQLEGKEQIRLIRYRTYEDIIEAGIFRFFTSEAARKFQRRFQRENLLQEYEDGRRWFFEQCQVVYSEGTIHWMTLGANLSKDQENGDICLFVYMLGQDRLRKWEAGLDKPAVRNPVTGIYDKNTYQALVRNLLNRKGSRTCGLVQIRIGGAEDFSIEKAWSRKMDDLATAFLTFLGTDCVMSRADGYSLLAFFPDTGAGNRIKIRLENAFSFVRVSLGDVPEMMSLRFVAGIAFAPAETADYEKIVYELSKLCTIHAGEAADAVFSLEKNTSYRWSWVELTESVEHLEARPLDFHRTMAKEAEDVALECLDWMLGAESTDISIDGVLQKLGAYYQADRVYILILTEDGKTVTMLNEWVGAGKYSIQQSISGKKTEHFPVIARAASRTEPLVLSMKNSQENTSAKENWRYVVFPMEKEQDSIQLLCIENPQCNMEETALLKQLIPHLSRERSRFSMKHEDTSPLSRLFSLPNGQAYQDTVYSLNSDTCSSVGAMALDIPELEPLKIRNGYEYGNRFLLRVSEVLLDVFGKFFVYHTQETEFIVLCKNITYETFYNQCARAKQLIGRKYSGQFRVGCIWSDGIFSAKDLVERARSIMKCAGSTEMAASSGEWGGFLSEEFPWSKKQQSGRFMIYLQPKIDMHSGRMVGAEALVRIMDEKGNFLSHIRVIEEMEKEGTIQELDYYVFDKVLYALSQWKKKGCRIMPISSNFSRKTLMNPSSLASILAILSRYPDIPQEMVELEITETAGDYGNQTFLELIRRFDEYGLQFSLDDFGSSYSNLSMLTNLHFHSVKLDRSMIKGISGNAASRTLVRDIVKLCGDCGMICIAEGVETQEQADMLLEDGCIYAQGYLYGRPMSLQEFEQTYFQV